MKSNIYPSFISNNNFKYIKLDNKYIASLVIYEFPGFNTFLSIIEDVPKDVEYTICMYINKQDTYKVLKELTNSISNSRSELKMAKNSQIDIDVVNKLRDDANFLRKEIQVNNQEIFNLNLILTFYSEDKNYMLNQLKYFQSRLYAKQLYSKITNFRHLEEYILSLPLNKSESFLLKQNYKTLTTNALSNIFPFYTKNIFDVNGIIFGKILSQNKLCSIDIFNPNYLNSNMCIFGSSGAGKSFFAKILIIRHFFNNKNQFIFDLEGEYSNIVRKLKGEVFEFNKDYINILEINEFELKSYGKNFYDKKINKVIDFFQEALKINDVNIINDLKKSLDISYMEYGINNNVDSLYIKKDNKIYLKNIFRKRNEFPTINDLLRNIKLDTTRKIIDILKQEFPYICGVTNVNINNRLLSFDISNTNFNTAKFFINYILEIIILKIKCEIDLNINNIIYIDEVWKYMEYNTEISDYIFNLFKTIRKLNSSIVVITQDIGDIFSKENVNIGKSILNNCFFKIIFRLDFKDVKLLSNISGIDNELLESINYLDKGQGIFLFNNNIMKLIVEACNYELNLICRG